MIPGASIGDRVLSVVDVEASRGGARVLDGVRFDVFDRIREGRTTGQVVGVLGPSGVGKTTLLRVLAGLDHADSGSVRGPNGCVLDAHGVGIVFQHYPLLAHRDVLSNLLVAARAGGLDARAAERRARELLVRLGLAAHGHSYPAQLSGGQRQRAAIAQQLMLPRRVLLLDEPFSGLDPKAAREVIALVREVADEHELNTVVLVTHDIRAAIRASDTLVLLGAGERGATVRAVYDLVDLGLAWEAAESRRAEVAAFAHTIESRFEEL